MVLRCPLYLCYAVGIISMWETIVERWGFLTREQKLSVSILTVCGVIAVGFSVYRIQDNITRPFRVQTSSLVEAKRIIGLSPEEEDAKAKRTDTDGDGLSDWAETNLYHTNPNLRDTCGDGVPDNVRIFTGRNIACLQQTSTVDGRLDVSQVGTASSGLPTYDAPQAPQNASLQQLLDAQGAQQQAVTTTNAPADIQAIRQALPRDPAAIRQALTGRVDANQLKATSDADLLKFYDQAIGSLKTQQASPSDPSSPL